ncbi:acyl-CoA/acyl-ACP dehydrogenase [Microbacterium sp. LWH7-1.2]|uniref:acyl-CoA dehydrogenase family protein n=1 Tax=Microbacterium sp. LWH7-1.2 TaxID=3135257 RepID=UPI003138D52A
MSDDSDQIAEVVDEVLSAWGPADQAKPETSLAAWEALLELGFPYVSLDEDLGGSGGSHEDAFAVLRALGAHGSGAPIAESGLLAGWLLTQAGLEIEPRLVAFAPPLGGTLTYDGRTVAGEVSGVAWAEHAAYLVALAEGPDGPVVVEVPAEALAVSATAHTLAGTPRSRVVLDQAAPARVAPSTVDAGRLLRRAAATRVALIAGGLERARDLSVRYTAERVQFGQPVAKFQAVQVHLARLAEDAALVGMTADLVASALDSSPDPAFDIAAATLVARASTRESTKAAHQAHGAMGVTREYPLHVVTRHLWQWAHDYGSLSLWRGVVLDAVRAGGADGYYPLIAAETNGPGR